MPLSTTDLVAIFRSEMSDPELPGSGDSSDSLWEDADIIRWIGESQKELCERVDILFDATSYVLTTADGTDLYALDDVIMKIRRGKVAAGRTLESVSVKELLRRYQPTSFEIDVTDWEGMTGEPKYIVTDYEVGFVKLVPEPVGIETIELHVYRLPVNDIVMEIPNKYRRKLLHKVKHLAYMKDDVDSQDLKKAGYHDDRWEAAVNEIDRQFKRLNRGPQVVAYGGL
jgi:hypothetical protein